MHTTHRAASTILIPLITEKAAEAFRLLEIRRPMTS